MSLGGGFLLEERRGLTVLRHDALASIPELAHAFSTRCCDGATNFDLGGAEDPVAPSVAANRSRFLAAAGFEASRATILRQVHGSTIVRARALATPVEADGALWSRVEGDSGLPSVRSADCVPILLAARDGSAAAAVHAGWRGTAAQVVMRAVEALKRAGARTEFLEAVLGPSIGPCCYPVGHDVFRAVTASLPGRTPPGGGSGEGPFRLDLAAVNRGQLVASGVPPGNIHGPPACTSCRADLFFSYRRDGAGAGRMMAAVGPARRVDGEWVPFAGRA